MSAHESRPSELYPKVAALPTSFSGPINLSEAPQSLLDISSSYDFENWSHNTLPRLGEDLEGRSGIIASMMVLRHILRNVNLPMRKDMMAGFPHPPLVVATLGLDGEKSFETARAGVTTTAADTSFVRLMESRAMHKSFWQIPGFLAFMPSVTEEVQAEDITKLARLSLVTVGDVGANDSSLKQALAPSMDRLEIESRGHAWGLPHIIRARWKYTPPSNPEVNPSSFSLKRRGFKTTFVDDDRAFVTLSEPSEGLYNCIAVVRLRSDNDNATGCGSSRRLAFLSTTMDLAAQ